VTIPLGSLVQVMSKAFHAEPKNESERIRLLKLDRPKPMIELQGNTSGFFSVAKDEENQPTKTDNKIQFKLS
jgi:hypothetical protein